MPEQVLERMQEAPDRPLRLQILSRELISRLEIDLANGNLDAATQSCKEEIDNRPPASFADYVHQWLEQDVCDHLFKFGIKSMQDLLETGRDVSSCEFTRLQTEKLRTGVWKFLASKWGIG